MQRLVVGVCLWLVAGASMPAGIGALVQPRAVDAAQDVEPRQAPSPHRELSATDHVVFVASPDRETTWIASAPCFRVAATPRWRCARAHVRFEAWRPDRRLSIRRASGGLLLPRADDADAASAGLART